MKSYVTLEQHVCAVCCITFDTGVLLIDKRLRNKFKLTTVTAMSLCKEHAALKEQGYVALVEIDPAKSKSITKDSEVLHQRDAYRTGNYAHLREAVFRDLTSKEPPECGVVFVDAEVIDWLKTLQKEEEDDESAKREGAKKD